MEENGMMMKERFLTELEKKIHEICNISSQKQRELEQEVYDAIEHINRLSVIGKKKGLLALEEAVAEIKEDDRCGYVKAMIIEVVDGTGPEELEFDMWLRYYGKQRTACEDYVYLIYLCGILMIQRNLNPRLIEGRLEAMLPSCFEKGYAQLCSEMENKAQDKPEEIDMTLVEKLCRQKVEWESTDPGYYEMRLAEFTFQEMDDRAIQRWFREVDFYELALIMRGLSGCVRERIFNNLPKRVAVSIAEDIEYMGKQPCDKIATTMQKAFAILMKLIDCGEISIGCDTYLQSFHSFFHANDEMRKQQKKRYSYLKDLLFEYDRTESKKM